MKTQNNAQAWYTILTAGSAYNPTPARGPFKSIEAAREAAQRFRERHGWKAGSYLAATSAAIAGPYASRKAAKDADISDRKLPVVEGIR